jgi:hypothetical protein
MSAHDTHPDAAVQGKRCIGTWQDGCGGTLLCDRTCHFLAPIDHPHDVVRIKIWSNDKPHHLTE